jgi:hypothetical protein
LGIDPLCAIVGDIPKTVLINSPAATFGSLNKKHDSGSFLQ